MLNAMEKFLTLQVNFVAGKYLYAIVIVIFYLSSGRAKRFWKQNRWVSTYSSRLERARVDVKDVDDMLDHMTNRLHHNVFSTST